MEFKPNSEQIREEKQRRKCSIDEAQRYAQKKLIMKAASDIDTVKDCRRFLMNLVEILA